MQVTGPYHVARPRYSGEHHAVTVKSDVSVLTRGFRTAEAAQAFAKTARKARSMAQLRQATTVKQGALLTPTILVVA